MVKNCVLYDNKVCNNCGECDICDLDQNKICDNCGKCLEGYDYTGIQVDDLMVDETAGGEIDTDYQGDRWKFEKNSVDGKSDEDMIYIEDIEGLSEEIEHNHGHHHHNHDHDHNYN